MFKLCALNNSALQNDKHGDSSPFWEVLEASAAKIHQDAISYLANNKLNEAEECFLQVLENPFINKASSDNDNNSGSSQERALKYSSLKNLGGICMKHKKYEEASKYYLKAVNLDSSEVLIWQKLGIAAIRSRHSELAFAALQEGLKINPNHWPCLDQMLSVLYLLGLQEDCLGLCIKLLQKDPNYVKALAFKDRIFKDQPHIIGFIKSFYLQSDILFRDISYDSAKGDQYIANCLEFRPKLKEGKLNDPVQPRNTCNSLKNLTWEDLGIALRQIYDDVIEKEATAFGAKVDLEESLKKCLDKKFGRDELDDVGVKNVSRSLSYEENIICPRSLDNEQNLHMNRQTPPRRKTIEVCNHLGDDVNVDNKLGRRDSSITAVDVSLNNPAIDNVPGDLSDKPNEEKFESKEDIEMLPANNEMLCLDEVKETFKNEDTGTELSKHSIEDENCSMMVGEKNCILSALKNTDNKTTDCDNLIPVIEENQVTAEPKSECLTTHVPKKINSNVKSGMENNTESIVTTGDMKIPIKTDETKPSIDMGYTKLSFIKHDTEVMDPLEYTIDNKETANVDGSDPINVDFELVDTAHVGTTLSELDLANQGVASFVREIGQFFTEQEMNFIVADNQVGSLTSDGERNSASDPEKIQEIDSCSKDSDNSSDAASDPKIASLKDNAQKNTITEDISDIEETEKDTAIINKSSILSVTGISSKKSPKKTRRPKRGLERELEQLDYWGRRKAREAKRRRKTITSKLVGVFEDGEYLSLNHLFRSFIPASLISSEENNKNSTPKKYKEGVGLCSSIKTSGVETSTRKRKLSEVSCSRPSIKKAKLDHNEAISSLGEDERKYVTEMVDKFDENVHPEWTLEEFQVTKFVSQYKYCVNILDLILLWETTLINFYGNLWPKNVASCFNDIYLRGRNHVWKGLDMSESPKRLTKLGKSALANLELAISLFLCASENPEDSEKATIRKKLECETIDDDLLYLSLLSSRCDLWKEDYLQFNLRLRWIQAQINLIKKRANETAIILQILFTELQLSCREDEDVCIDRCRIDVDSITVNSSQVQYQLSVLQRSNMLEGVGAKYDSGCYDEVVLVLSATFDKSTPMVASTTTNNCPSRRNQLMLLIKALQKLNDFTGVVDWSGVCLAEALQSYKKLGSEDEQEHRSWAETISTTVKFVYEAFTSEELNLKSLRAQSLPKLVASLVELIVVQLEQNTNMTHLYFGSVMPWILLHIILSKEENCHSHDSTQSDAESDIRTESMKEQTFSSTLFLITAHEELGKNGWCGLECGKLLIYTCDVLMKELSRSLSQDQRTAISQALDQNTYCLYSHPQRRTKHKHIRDHGIQPVLLTWAEAVKLYKFYYPAHLPDFQSSDIPSINEDMAVFIKRFISLYPETFKVEEETKKVELFLDCEEPTAAYTESRFSLELENAHYLIADYHFKNKEWDLASDYYKQDVAINVSRLESWAAMGLGKKAQLETLLNSCDVIKNLNEFFNKSQIAIRCLNRALVLDKLHYNLWVERGALLFMTHSHASRTLKQDINPLMSMELFASLERMKSNSLDLSKICFTKAIKLFEEETDDSLPDERWLYYYMLGKVAEKDGSGPRCVIDSYTKAFDYLHRSGAKYPARINYNNPQENSIEALEIYFRVFAYILKYLTQKETGQVDLEELKYFHMSMVKFSTGPFATQKENKNLRQESTTASSPEHDEVRSFVAKLVENVVSKAIENTFEIVNKVGDTAGENASNKEPISIEQVIDECLIAMKLCMTRFPHHYKSVYRIAHYFYHSSVRKDVVRARNYILGCQHWQKLDYMPVNGLFNDRKIFMQNPRMCNFFNGVWRIPNDEIDRPGSFAAHMYKCICMLLEILKELNDFLSIFEIAFSLKFSPDKDKKYLRDNERELLSQHAIQVGIQALKDKYQQIFPNSSKGNFSRQQSLILEIYKSYKFMSRHLSGTDTILSKLLVDGYSSVNGISAAESNAFILREAEVFCARNLSTSRQQVKPQAGTALAPVVPGAVKRGRPPGPAKIKNLSKFDSQIFAVSSQIQAVQQAYRVYENFAQAQTLVTSKTVDPKIQQHHQKICDGYQKQLMQYLQIPSVSRYFSSSLQSLGSAPAKLPPPSLNSPGTSKSKESAQDHLLACLAAKSQAHGISITTASKKDSLATVPAPSALSITVTSVKTKPLVDSIKTTSSLYRVAQTTTTTPSQKSTVTITSVPLRMDRSKELSSNANQFSKNVQQSISSEVEADSDITYIVPPDPLSIEDVLPNNPITNNQDDIIILD